MPSKCLDHRAKTEQARLLHGAQNSATRDARRNVPGPWLGDRDVRFKQHKRGVCHWRGPKSARFGVLF